MSQNVETASKKLVVGCGYLGRRVAQRWRDQGDRVYATSRSAEGVRKLQQEGFHGIQFDVSDQPLSKPAVKSLGKERFDTVLFSVGFDRRAGKSIRAVYVEGLKNYLAAISSASSRFVYISSTGVYGTKDGSVVDEETECIPTRAGGLACLQAESILRQHSVGNNSIVLRLAGIYGPGRVPRLNELNDGESFACDTEGWLNLIHVEDAVEAVIRAETYASAPDLFLVADGVPVRRRDFYDCIASLLRMTIKYRPLDPKTSRGQRSTGSKKCSNAKMHHELGVVLRYPSYREGLQAVFSKDS